MNPATAKRQHIDISGRDFGPQDVLEDFGVRVLTAWTDHLRAGRWENRPLVNSYWRLYLHDRPGAMLLTDDGPMPMLADQVYLIPPGLDIGSTCDGDTSQFFVHFDLTGIPPISFRELFPGPALAPHPPRFTETIREAGERIQAASRRELSLDCSVKGIVYEAFGYYLAALPAGVMEQYRRRASAIKPVLTAVRWIEENLEKRITNEQLASLCSLSEDHFIRRFHNALGLPPAQYVMKQRLAKAGQHLLFTDLTIDEIAAITGFGDRFYFSRVFARETGLPPATYRRGGRT